MPYTDKLIHLLYVPTTFCNLGCTYCYLGKQTNEHLLLKDTNNSLNTLDYAVNKFKSAGVTPFNISLHGGEVTTLSGAHLKELFEYITNYYKHNQDVLENQGFKKHSPHIKTNLYNFDKHRALLADYAVSISASIDLPLSLHEKYRVTKRNTSTLKRTLQNLKLLAQYPHAKKLSAVLYDEHLDKTDEIIQDIWHLHNDYQLNMNKFNFMFGFESNFNQEKFVATDIATMGACRDHRQAEFYYALKNTFTGTVLEEGFKHLWFEEFTPNYCTHASNCGEKFFLLQSDGNVYSCVRGQGVEAFHYGNIYHHSVEEILKQAEHQIRFMHQTHGLDEDCKQCDYLSICHTGCPFVKSQQHSGKSYSCALQKAIYQDYPDKYPRTREDGREQAVKDYIVDIHPHLITTDLTPNNPKLELPNDLHHEKNALTRIIESDNTLKLLYAADQVILKVDGQQIALASQILKTSRTITQLSLGSEVEVHISDQFIKANCPDLRKNTLHLQLLRDTPVVYGDEQRQKQEHLFNLEVYAHQLQPSAFFPDGLMYELGAFLQLAKDAFIPRTLNNLFITTQYLRKYHYQKQQSNGFYHIQALNLPFHNIEFYWQEEKP